jgi:hypothetical protein
MEYRNVSAKLAMASVQRINASDDRRERRYALTPDDLLDIARTCRLRCPSEWSRDFSSRGCRRYWQPVENEKGAGS